MIVRNVYSRLWKFPSSLLDRLVESPRCKLQRPSGLRPLSTTPTRYANPLSTDSLPRIAQPSLWRTVIPSAWRRLPSRKSSPDVSNTRRSKGWNPATFYIVIFLLIGSQAIHMITLRKDFATFSRRADAKIALLKEVIERVQRGEDVDVKGLLGTGDKTKEKEWEEVLKEIEKADVLWHKKAQRRSDGETGAKAPGADTVSMQADTVQSRELSANVGGSSVRSGSTGYGFY